MINNINFDSLKRIPFSQCKYENFEMRKHFDIGTKRVNSMNVSPCGNFMASSTNDDRIFLFDILLGSEINNISTQKYGCNNVVFTDNELNTLHTSTKINNDIRLLSLEEKKYIRYFNGHKKNVLSLSISPCDKTFLSSSQDGKIKLWDFRIEECCNTSNYYHINPRVAYDPKGIIYAISEEKNVIKFFDSRYMNDRPFKIISLKSPTWRINNIKFSHDGRKILASADGNFFYLIDTFTGEKMSFRGIKNCRRMNFGVDLSPCGNYIVAGSDFGDLLYYDAKKGNILKTFKSLHTNHVENVIFHKKYLMLITGANDLIFWTPDYNDDNVFRNINLMDFN
ncbi:WD40 repeat and WD40/YVTN repeat-like-containing domain and WD40-repeat-containing domain-containing protein [Strongyloides ratti]|uniref:WD40 repeat and WD40/YVTN repeat-like-containing domain and WD40-repeat-containing domain-containing protein n=1 Tax=Strongyloides ratti TaxID=34506 RepID=A0A090KWW6_STRRB|nr:WD40 repeat and WD40/YVTN repeat-like-containing domain and WD40-repeat-containing domain-containing protein [Strongyloides ratti]CEF61921.1 WD40 repeat and WD40/YVTN repeat-like-containing domain and WD40-repeat-containing domain-containing protein [Strongyloides ratti]